MDGDERSNLAEFEAPFKRTLHLPDLLPEPDVEKLFFPGGVVCEVHPQSGAELANRVELLTQEDSSTQVGVMRQLFVGYASHPVILDIARRSNYVVEVRTVDWIKKHPAENYLKDLLVVKRASDKGSPKVEGKVIVSNPLTIS